MSASRTLWSRRAFVLAAPLGLAACGAPEPIWAPQEAVNRARYRAPGPASVTLITMRNEGSGNGAHSALLINADQRAMFDPAGTFRLPIVPERNDVLYGITPLVERLYISYHSRESYYTVVQERTISDAAAQTLLRAAESYGAVAKTRCAVATGRVLKNLPEYADLRVSLSPERLEEQFAAIGTVTTREYHETDSDDRTGLLDQMAESVSGQPTDSSQGR